MRQASQFLAKKRIAATGVADIRRCLKRAVARQLFKLLERYDRSAVEVVKVA